MKPITKLFGVLYRLLGPLVRILFPADIEGLENVPPSGVLFCPNHIHNLDPLVIAAALPVNSRLHFMGKAELFNICRPLTWFFHQLGGFPVNRGGNDIQAVKTAIQALKDGDNLMIFPEGTVIRDGVGHADGLPAHAKAGVAMIGVRTGATIIPVFVSGEKKFLHRCRVVFGKPYVPVYTGRRGTAEEMQKIADDILKEAYALGSQAVGGKPLCQTEE